LTQEIFLAVMGSIDSCREHGSFESWVFGLARNVVREHLRSTQRRQVREMHAQIREAPPTPEDELLGRRVAETFSRRLAAAESWQAEAFALRYFDRLPRSEIARRAERTRFAVRTSVERLRNRVAIDLELPQESEGTE
jgi:RNA polymerase sigma factor (sigma-70 family)